MEVINKFYSSVSQTVSQLSSVLPGNPVTREYDVTGHIASAGRGCMWKIYSGSKRSTKQEASIFVLEKKLFERYSKEDREEIFDIVKRGIIQLTKIRHPQVLTVQHPLEESRESFAFATEPVHASLANILGDTTNVPQSVTSELADYSLYETEIKYGLLQLLEGIQFIHNEAKLVHRNISPHSVVLNCHGIWKIFGFEYCLPNQDSNRYDFDPNRNILAIPSLEYTAPECVLDNKFTARADFYSMGILICAVYAKKCNPFRTIGRDYTVFKKFAADLRAFKHPNLIFVPQDVRGYVETLLTASPDKRPDIFQLSKIPFFDDIGVKSLSYLDTLFQRDNQEKAKFYKGLSQIIKRLPARINLHRILPCLVKEFVNPNMIPFVLPNVLLISEDCSKSDFGKHVFVHLKPIMNLHEPIQILLIFMQNMELLLKLTPTNDVKLHVLPMVYKALESNSKQIQELCLAVLPSFANLVDYPSMKNSLLPRIKNLCTSSGVSSVRVNCLLCIGQLLPHLDKWIVLDDILLFLPTITPREPAVIMAIIGIYKIATQHETLGIPKEFTANKVLPFLWPLSIENNLTIQQYNTIMVLIKDLAKRVELEHTRKLEQLNTENDSPLQLEIIAPVSNVKNSANDTTNDFLRKDNRENHSIKADDIIANKTSMIPMETSLAPIAFKPIQAPAFKPIQAPVKQFSSLASMQHPASWTQQTTKHNYIGSQSNQFQSLLLSPNGSNNNHVSSSSLLLQPINSSRSNTTSQSDNILTKEDILEFLK